MDVHFALFTYFIHSSVQNITIPFYETACNLPAPQPQRCDDPIDRSSGLVDPDVMSTLSLQTVKTYVGDDSSTTHLDYSYSFAYQESAFGNCPSADTTLSSAYCAGNHLLTSITPTVYQNGTGHQTPGVTFAYSGGRTNKYDDSSQSYHMENSWNYLTSYHDHSNGVGASTIVYHTAYNNSHGTPYIAGDNRYDALFCINNVGSCNSGTSFYPMDDKMWTEQVVTQITSSGKDSSASSIAPATTTYKYWLTKTQGSCPVDTATPPDSDCVGFGWIPNSGTDWQSFYHGEFRGFGTVLITSPAGDLTVDQYASTWGWDSPSSDARNYLAGQLLEEDIYQGGTVTDANLLTKTVTSYGGLNSTSAACASTSTYPSTTYRPCEVVDLNTRTTQYEKTGSSNANVPWVQHDNTYDDYTTSGGLGDHHQSPATGSYHIHHIILGLWPFLIAYLGLRFYGTYSLQIGLFLMTLTAAVYFFCSLWDIRYAYSHDRLEYWSSPLLRNLARSCPTLIMTFSLIVFTFGLILLIFMPISLPNDIKSFIPMLGLIFDYLLFSLIFRRFIPAWEKQSQK